MPWILLCVLFLIPPAAGSLARADEWPQAEEPRSWSFPRDHGSHPEYRTEWWYFTGNLTDARGRQYGYQVTFFRQGVRSQAAGENPWSLRDVYFAHAAVTDADRGIFRFRERVSRTGPGLAGAAPGRMAVWLLDWSAALEDGRFYLRIDDQDLAMELELSPERPPVLHGEGGLSRKGSEPGQASYYASIPRLATRGTLRSGPEGETVSVAGTSWFDQEFGSNQLGADQVGWDWFSLHLSDGRDLMLYLLRRTDGSVEPASSGTLVEPDGAARHLRLSDFRAEVLSTWESTRTGAVYPAAWRISVESAGIELMVRPLLADQELVTSEAAEVAYWEGAVRGEGRAGETPLGCEGYVELTGYDQGMGGLF